MTAKFHNNKSIKKVFIQKICSFNFQFTKPDRTSFKNIKKKNKLKIGLSDIPIINLFAPL